MQVYSECYASIFIFKAAVTSSTLVLFLTVVVLQAEVSSNLLHQRLLKRLSKVLTKAPFLAAILLYAPSKTLHPLREAKEGNSDHDRINKEASINKEDNNKPSEEDHNKAITTGQEDHLTNKLTNPRVKRSKQVAT